MRIKWTSMMLFEMKHNQNNSLYHRFFNAAIIFYNNMICWLTLMLITYKLSILDIIYCCK